MKAKLKMKNIDHVLLASDSVLKRKNMRKTKKDEDEIEVELWVKDEEVPHWDVSFSAGRSNKL